MLLAASIFHSFYLLTYVPFRRINEPFEQNVCDQIPRQSSIPRTLLYGDREKQARYGSTVVHDLNAELLLQPPAIGRFAISML